MRSKINIAVAFLIGLTMIGGAFYLSKQNEEIATTQSLKNSAPIRTFIKVEDKDGNGIMDWQDELGVNTIDLDAKPSTSTKMTKTASLAADLAGKAFIGEEGDALTGLSSIGQRLAMEAIDKQYTKNDIKVGSLDSIDSWRTYGNRIASITFANSLPAGTDNELIILNRAMIVDDATILASLDPIIKAYEGMVSDMLQTTVPPSLTKEHISLLNVYNAILIDIRAFRELFTDALPAMTRLRRYQADTDALYLAISNLYLRLDQKGIKWNETDEASRFIKIE